MSLLICLRSVLTRAALIFDIIVRMHVRIKLWEIPVLLWIFL